MSEKKITFNKSEVATRFGWTAGRVDKFLTPEHVHSRRGFYGCYDEYEYSLPAVLEAENNPEWLKAAGRYLKVKILTYEMVASLRLEREAEAARKALLCRRELARASYRAKYHVPPMTPERRAKLVAEWQERQEWKAQCARVRGGLCRAGFAYPLYDGWTVFGADEVMPYIRLLDESKRLPVASYITRFYTLWKAGEGYCNRLGSVRRIIAPVKQTIMDYLTTQAQARGWVYGEKAGVLYIETPEGQASFHLRGAARNYPPYRGEWTGHKNSQQILEQLFGCAKTARGA